MEMRVVPVQLLRMAVVGCGNISAVHAKAIQALPGAKLAAVCDSAAEKARAAGERYGVD